MPVSRGQDRLVRNETARFDQLQGMTDPERDAARERIRAAVVKHGDHVSADDWRDLCSRCASEGQGRG
jgi:hypothetical protein